MTESQRREYEQLLISEALRRSRRYTAAQMKAWTVVSQMSRGERVLIRAVTLFPRLVARLRDRLRS